MKSALLALLWIFSFSAFAKKVEVTYFSCTIKEEGKVQSNGKRRVYDVQVKFAIKNLGALESKSELVNYPGTSEDDGAILVVPKEIEGRYSMMNNLNSQGGDLHITSGGDIDLFGDGDGYQFTDLVVWENPDYSEGYVRDYGSTYGDTETFKQFIKCKKSATKL